MEEAGDPETLFDNSSATFVEIGTLASNITYYHNQHYAGGGANGNSSRHRFPADRKRSDRYLCCKRGCHLVVIRGARGTLESVHLAGTPVYLLTTTNGGLGRTLTTRTWAYGSSHQNALLILGKALRPQQMTTGKNA